MLYAICSASACECKALRRPQRRRCCILGVRARARVAIIHDRRPTGHGPRLRAPQMIMFKARGEIDCATQPCRTIDAAYAAYKSHLSTNPTFVCVKSIHLYTLTSACVRARGLHQHHINPASRPAASVTAAPDSLTHGASTQTNQTNLLTFRAHHCPCKMFAAAAARTCGGPNMWTMYVHISCAYIKPFITQRNARVRCQRPGKMRSTTYDRYCNASALHCTHKHTSDYDCCTRCMLALPETSDW